MIHTLLLEPYCYPRVVPIEVTILRGARRLRFSNALRKKYGDFAPKIWHYLLKLGYKKFLQRIYLSIDHDTALTSPYYQFPILLSILEALSLIPKQNDILTMGKINEYGHVISPITNKDILPITPFQWYLPSKQSLNQELNHVLAGQFSMPMQMKKYFTSTLLELLLPDCIIINNSLQLDCLATSLLRRIEPTLLAKCRLSADLAKLEISSSKYELFERLLNKSKEVNVINDKKEVASMTTSSFLKLISNDKVKT